MRICLSKHWQNSSRIFNIIIAFVVGIALWMMILGGFDGESMIVSLLCAGSFIICFTLTYYLPARTLRRYIIIEDNKITNYYYNGEETAVVSIEEPIYYDVKKLVEGMFNTSDFVIISNRPIDLSVRYGENRLGIICKAIDHESNVMICPCDDRIVRLLKAT